MSFKNYLVEAYSKAMSAELTSQQLKMIGDHFAKQYNVDVNNSSFEVVSPSKLSRDTDIFVYVSKNGTIYSAILRVLNALCTLQNPSTAMLHSWKT